MDINLSDSANDNRPFSQLYKVLINVVEYNHIRPHGSLMGKTPARYLEECEEKVQKAA